MPSDHGAVGHGVHLHVVLSSRHCIGLASMEGRELSFATELPGKEFSATTDPIP